MMEGTGYNLSDLRAAVDRNGCYGDGMGYGMGGWFWILILFLFRGNCGWGNGYGENPLISEEFIKRDIFNTNQNVSNTGCQTQRDVLESSCTTQRDILENRYTNQLGLQQLGSKMNECLNKFFKAMKNFFTIKVNTVGTYA